MTIDDLRIKIDQLDQELLRIFNERADLALQIGHLKKALDLPVYNPGREQYIFDKMQQLNPGPLDDQAIKRMFERVIDESRTLERIKSKGR
ncbi:MAG: chorismate mutase [Desulfuromonadaceae bacterium]|nr:chorismate mutase [Desulfuromonas sp.]MDY0184726.1 chorismate mutase [Desulfuromonadaceae bacterium]